MCHLRAVISEEEVNIIGQCILPYTHRTAIQCHRNTCTSRSEKPQSETETVSYINVHGIVMHHDIYNNEAGKLCENQLELDSSRIQQINHTQ